MGVGVALSSGDTAATVELRNFGALRQSVSPSCAALRCGVEFQLQHNGCSCLYGTRVLHRCMDAAVEQQDTPRQVTDLHS